MHDTVDDLGFDALRLRRRAATGQRIGELFREAARALADGKRLVAEALLSEARNVTEEFEATADPRRWLRWTSSDVRRLAALESELDDPR
jgi:hypothetical protein